MNERSNSLFGTEVEKDEQGNWVKKGANAEEIAALRDLGYLVDGTEHSSERIVMKNLGNA